MSWSIMDELFGFEEEEEDLVVDEPLFFDDLDVFDPPVVPDTETRLPSAPGDPPPEPLPDTQDLIPKLPEKKPMVAPGTMLVLGGLYGLGVLVARRGG